MLITGGTTLHAVLGGACPPVRSMRGAALLIGQRRGKRRVPDKAGLDQDREVFAGVDTHKELHVAAVIDTDDTVLGTRSFSTTRTGYRTMLTWIGEYGTLIRIGVEGTGSYGAGLIRHPLKRA